MLIVETRCPAELSSPGTPCCLDSLASILPSARVRGSTKPCQIYFPRYRYISGLELVIIISFCITSLMRHFSGASPANAKSYFLRGKKISQLHSSLFPLLSTELLNRSILYNATRLLTKTPREYASERN